MAGPPRRLCGLANHLHPYRYRTSSANDSHPGAAADCDSDASRSTRLISWDEIQRHSMIEDAWVVIDGVVYDITEFIKEDSGHPGGADIPMEYAGKDATEFWTDMQYEPRRTRMSAPPAHLCTASHECA